MQYHPQQAENKQSSQLRVLLLTFTPAAKKMDLRESIANQTDVALSLSKQLLLTQAKASNLVFSPFSIQVVLSRTATCSAGPTQLQLLSFLKTKSSDHLHSVASQLITFALADGSATGWLLHGGH